MTLISDNDKNKFSCRINQWRKCKAVNCENIMFDFEKEEYCYTCMEKLKNIKPLDSKKSKQMLFTYEGKLI